MANPKYSKPVVKLLDHKPTIYHILHVHYLCECNRCACVNAMSRYPLRCEVYKKISLFSLFDFLFGKIIGMF
jgi:hypothetical protein